MDIQDYDNKSKELSIRYKATIKVGFNWKEEPCLELLNSDKAKTLKEMGVAKGFRIGFNCYGSTYEI